MIVMKFGGTSVGTAERMLAAAEIVRRSLDRRPVVVVSALAGVTDLLQGAIDAARRGDRDALEPLLSDLERRHRWALAGGVQDMSQRHKLGLEVDRLFSDLRERLRSMRILAKVTPRAADGVLAFGERLAAPIVAAVFRDRGLCACRVDAREVVRTDESYGAAEVDLPALRELCRERVGPRIDAGELPVLEGFIGATASGQTTTLGRGGSDTSAALLGLALEAEEIQIWTDVDGLMSADPRIVPGARTLERVSFREAAELAAHGARVLHPAAVAPAVRRQIPVRVLNSLRPEGPGTLIVGDADPASAGAAAPIAVASREDICLIRVRGRALREDSTLLPSVLERCQRRGLTPTLVVASGLQVTLVVPRGAAVGSLEDLVGTGTSLEHREACGLVCVVGAGLAQSGVLRLRVLTELIRFDPELVATGAAETSVAAVLSRSVLVQAVRELHRTFFEGALAS